jgi:hypothetical protein
MWRVRIFYIILGLIALGVVRESVWIRPRFELSKDAQIRFSNIPGKIDIKFVSGKIWTCTIVKGQLSIQNVKEYESGWMESRPDIKFQKDIPQGLPTLQGFGYYGPYRVSPDKSLILFSLSSEKTRYLPTSFVIVNADDRKMLGHEKTDSYIEDIVWSPDSNMFVVLEDSARRSLSVTGLIGMFLAHPRDIHTFYLGIYDRKGNRLFRCKIASGLLGGSAQVFWN